MRYLIAFYGVALLTLGALGFTKGGSLVSLIMGSLSGLAALVGAYLYNTKRGRLFCLILLTAMTALFTVRFVMSGKTFPGVMAAVSMGLVMILPKHPTR